MTNSQIELHRAAWRENWASKGIDTRNVCGMDDDDYVIILEYIKKYKPKHILEYGSGESTYVINQLLKELDYGGKITSYEDDVYWYNKIKTGGLDKEESVILADVELVPERVCNKVAVRYLHSYEHLQDVDLVLIDGPDIRKWNADTTINFLDLVNETGRQIPYFIDGRSGTKEFYDDLGYVPRIDRMHLI